MTQTTVPSRKQPAAAATRAVSIAYMTHFMLVGTAVLRVIGNDARCVK